jgi:hypothetical protein
MPKIGFNQQLFWIIIQIVRYGMANAIYDLPFQSATADKNEFGGLIK